MKKIKILFLIPFVALIFLLNINGVFANNDSITCLYYNEDFKGYQYLEITIDIFKHKDLKLKDESISDVKLKTDKSIHYHRNVTRNYLAYIYPDLNTCPKTIYVDSNPRGLSNTSIAIYGSKELVILDEQGNFKFMPNPGYDDIYEFNCVKNENGQTCESDGNTGGEKYDNYTDTLVSCGNGLLDKIPRQIPKVISILYNVIQVAIPIVLVVFGVLDLMKGITVGKEDEIKKGQKLFIKRLISAALVFFVFVIVKFLISIVADNTSSDIIDCAECFIEKKCDTVW